MLRLEDLRRSLRQAVNAQGTRVVQPRVTQAQVKLGGSLLTALRAGAPVRLANPPWEVVYSADALPEASTPAWTQDLSGSVGLSVSGGVLSVEDAS